MKSNGKLEEIFTAAQTPGYAIRKIEDNRIVFEDFGGLRAAGFASHISSQDLWHIGSCTKSMTAFLIGILVDEGQLAFDDKISKVFRGSIAENLKEITVLDLITHRSGLSEVTELTRMSWDSLVHSKESTDKLRVSLVDAILLETPKFSRDSQFEYCNSNYLILGAILEQAYGAPWEQILSDKIFKKLGMTDCGVGPPATKDFAPPDQPWGHKFINDMLIAIQPKFSELEPSDNPAALGPAGTVHCSFDSWSLFLKEMLAASKGNSLLLKPSTAEVLFKPHKDNVAGGGWGVVDRDWAQGLAYTMVGSNELNYAMYIIVPSRNVILMGATNSGAEASLSALSDQLKLLVK